MNEKMSIRKANPDDLGKILELYAHARTFMIEHGNPRQWAARNWPPEELVRKDIAEERSFVCTVKQRICGVFVYLYGKDVEPTYADIEGSWMNEEPYGVVHRIASDGTIHGTGTYCIEQALEWSGHLRIDTHPDNTVMQNLLKKLGFEKRGIIHVREDDDPRYAYERVLRKETICVPKASRNS